MTLPSGTVTFLFTDVEGSTRLLAQLGSERYGELLAEHHRLLREAFEGAGGKEVDTEGDAFFVAFESAKDAVTAAARAQRSLVSASLPDGVEIRVRMGIHTGEATRAGDKYVGLAVHRGARVCSAAHGRQVLVSQTTRELLADEELEGLLLRDLGEHRLKDLAHPQRLYQLVIDGVESEFPAPRTLENRPTNLPTQPTPLVGRERELQELRDVLRRPAVRLLTLTGPGGTGKTRLALQLAADSLEEFADGVFFVALAPIIDAKLVLPEIAQTLGVRETPERGVLDALIDYLRESRLLLVLDNFEQVVEAAADVGELLARTEALKIVATTREPLRVAGEQEWPVRPLALPDKTRGEDPVSLSQYEAVRLFIERARAVRPDFEVTNENAPAVAEICVRLDGLPLAIELAAARVKLLSPNDLLGRLEQRLKLLTGGPRAAPERQQTLRGAIDWSYGLLSGDERTLFARLAVFVGGWTLEAAEEVCDADLDALASLVDKSLVRQGEGSDGRSRFSVLETIREYASERLEEGDGAEATRNRHADYYVELAQAAERPLRGPDRRVWAARLDDEHDNIRAALSWTIGREEAERPLKIAAGVWFYWTLRGQLREGLSWIERGLERSDGSGSFLHAHALAIHGELLRMQGDADAAVAAKREALLLLERLGERRLEAAVHHDLGEIAAWQGDLARARMHHEKALELRRAIGDRYGIGHALSGLADLALREGDYATAASIGEELLEIARESGSDEALILALGCLGDAARRAGDPARAADLLDQALALSVESYDASTIAEGIEAFAALAADLDRPLDAARLWGAVEAMREETGFIVWDIPEHERCIASARERAGDEPFASAWDEGRRLAVERAVELARATAELARGAWRGSDPATTV